VALISKKEQVGYRNPQEDGKVKSDQNSGKSLLYLFLGGYSPKVNLFGLHHYFPHAILKKCQGKLPLPRPAAGTDGGRGDKRYGLPSCSGWQPILSMATHPKKRGRT